MKQSDVCVTGAACAITEGLPSSVSPTSSESRADSSVATVGSAASYLLTQRQHKGHRNVIPPPTTRSITSTFILESEDLGSNINSVYYRMND